MNNVRIRGKHAISVGDIVDVGPSENGFPGWTRAKVVRIIENDDKPPTLVVTRKSGFIGVAHVAAARCTRKRGQ